MIRLYWGATEERSPTGGRFSFNHPPRFFPEGAALCGAPAENLGEFDGRVLDGAALCSPSRAESVAARGQRVLLNAKRLVAGSCWNHERFAGRFGRL